MKFLAEIITTGFYTGKIPLMPGTFGSWASACLFALFHFYFPNFFILKNILIIIAITFILGLFFSHLWVTYLAPQEKDPGYIVIDEWVGQWLAYIFTPFGFGYLFFGFVLFRVFDIVKPIPINQSQKLPGGFGIMIDDVLAGLFAGLILWGFHFLIPS